MTSEDYMSGDGIRVIRAGWIERPNVRAISCNFRIEIPHRFLVEHKRMPSKAEFVNALEAATEAFVRDLANRLEGHL